MKRLSDLTANDLMDMPVWEYVDGSDGDISLEPVTELPVADLRNRVVGTRVELRNGERRWALLGNIDLRKRKSTCHFLTLSIEKHGDWFDLARYHDVDQARRGPDQLARFLGLPLNQVFPITYDITEVVDAEAVVAKGTITREPAERLGSEQLIRLALDQDDD